jgi:cytochrome c oxidase assembly protein subunit 11
MANPRRVRSMTAAALACVVLAMVGLSFAAVPLYRLFCQATGLGGTTQRAEALPTRTSDQLITVRFDAQTEPDLGWEFAPDQASVTVHPGEERVITYHARNLTDHAITGTATFNVTPQKVGFYFNKLQCFCFTAQHLEAGQSAELAVSFFVDPDMLNDPNTAEVRTITLSYTMFRAKNAAPGDATASAPAEAAGGSARPAVN